MQCVWKEISISVLYLQKYGWWFLNGYNQKSKLVFFCENLPKELKPEPVKQTLTLVIFVYYNKQQSVDKVDFDDSKNDFKTTRKQRSLSQTVTTHPP